MESASVLNYANILNDRMDYSDSGSKSISRTKAGSFSPSIIKMIAEGGENFLLYLKRHNFAKEVNLLVLSSVHHYYYDEKELYGVGTLINLKKLNHVKHLDRFLHTLFNVLPKNANFIGCFSNDKTQKQNGLSYYKPSRLLSRFINFIDSRTDHILDKSEVSEAFERNGHKIVDMTEMDGLTYFYSKNVNN